jgi:hypothetical protein
MSHPTTRLSGNFPFMSVRGLIDEAFRRSPVLASLGAANVGLALVFLALWPLDPTQILGISRWVKPLKFSVSIAIYVVTMGWILAHLMGSSRKAVVAITSAIAVAMAGEIILITMQSLRGVQSHFNAATLFDEAVFGSMGLLIALNTIAVIWATILFFMKPAEADGAYLTGIRLGLVVFLLASVEGGVMIGRNSHSVGVDDGGPGLPLVNWSTVGGDLRIAHFAGLHALQALPLLGWFLDRNHVPRARTIVVAASAGWVVISVLLYLQAMSGRALVRL